MVVQQIQNETVLYESSSTVVVRQTYSTEQSVIIKKLKQIPATHHKNRFLNEFHLLQKCKSPYIVTALELINTDEELAIVLVDDSSESLRQYAARNYITLQDKIHLFIQMTSAIATLHQQRIIMKDVNPNNFIINPATKALKCIDLNLAIEMERENQFAVPPTLLEGTLAYISPEQTGRMNRSIDARTDIYSLGVTAYELFTGQLPFETVDSMELIHCHLALIPISPHDIQPEIPPMISEIIMKCLQKNAEERYSSCNGLLHDLKRCYNEFSEKQAIDLFTLATSDEPISFQLTQKLYGREEELKTLLSAFQEVSNGSKKVVEIAGYSGIGKTAFVHELYRPLVKERGMFVSGKCEQYKKNQPYDVLIQALQQLIQNILAENEQEIIYWQQVFHEALYPNAQIIIDVIPELEHILGPQPAVKQLAQLESSQRFHLVFQSFLTCFTNEGTPLVLFLDDLQWIDTASLQLIQSFIIKPNVQKLLLICSYRDNEIVQTHPYFYLLEHLRRLAIDVTTIALQPIQKEDIAVLITDSFPIAQHAVEPLVQYVFSKTDGNPYFTNQLLLTLHEEGVLFYDRSISAYNWRPSDLTAIEISDSIVELMLKKIQKLPLDVQQTLKIAATISNKIDCALVAIASEQSKLQVSQHLQFAYEQGLIVPNNSTYELLKLKNSTIQQQEFSISYQFAHDRIQQAAYSLVSEQQRSELHLHIGQLLYKSCTPEQLEEQLFTVTNHFNAGITLLDDELSKIQLAQLNVRAALKAKATVAYDAAVKYLTIADSLTAQRYFDDYYELSITIVKELMECYFILDESELAERYFDLYIHNAQTNVEKAEGYYIKTLMYQNDYAYEPAIDACIEGLKLLDVRIPKRFITFHVGIELMKTMWHYRRINVRELTALPTNNDRAAEIASMLAVSLANNTYFVNVQQGFIGVLKMNQRSLSEGNTSTSAFTYLSYAIATNTIFKNYTKGHQLGAIAMELSEKLDDPIAPRNYFTFATAINHWHKHIKTNRHYTYKGYQTAIETGDIIYVGYNASLLIEEMLYYGEKLPVVEEELTKLQQYLQSHAIKTNEEMIALFQNYIDTLQGTCNETTSIIGTQFDEPTFLQAFGPPTNVFRYYIAKMDLLLLFNRHDEALQVANKAYELRNSSMGQLRGALYFFYQFLSLTANFNQFSTMKKHRTSITLKKLERKFANLAKHCPENFEHQHQLLSAELARVHLLSDKAFRHYDRAIRFAKQNGYVYHEAIANELAATHALTCQNTKLAELYMCDAYQAYNLLGATAKLSQLAEQYPQLLHAVNDYSSLMERPDTTHVTTYSANSQQLSVDLHSILKSAQMISNEIKLDKLLQQLMQNVMENAGAERGLLFMPQHEEWFLEANAQLGSAQIDVLQSIPLAQCSSFAQTIFQYVRRTKQSLVLHHAYEDERFENDSYIASDKPKSILCMPILYQHQLVAILYLENNLSTHIFTNDRIELLNILSSQAAISISNARLYETLDEQVQARTKQLEQTLQTLQSTQNQLVEAEKFSSLGNLVAGVAHEINTPIGVSVTAVTHLNEKTSEFVQQFESNQIKKSTLQNYLQQVQETSFMITTNLQRASDLIRSFKQVAVDQSTDINRTLHVKRYIDETLLSLKPNFKNRPVTIAVHCDDAIRIVSNAGAFSQLLTNLIVNALTHAFKDGRAGHIDIHVVANDETLTLQIADNGCGMPAHIRTKIFEPFFTTNRNNGGTGLGMHIVYNLVTQTLQGTITVDSHVDIGTTFTITLPLQLEGGI